MVDYHTLKKYKFLFEDADKEYRHHMRELQTGLAMIRNAMWDSPFVVNNCGELIYLSNYHRRNLSRNPCLKCNIISQHHHHLSTDIFFPNNYFEFNFLLYLFNIKNNLALFPKEILVQIKQFLIPTVYCIIPNSDNIYTCEKDLYFFRSKYLFFKYIENKYDLLPNYIYDWIVDKATKKISLKQELTKLINHLENPTHEYLE